MLLAHLTWPEAERLDRDIVILSPIAAFEQHSRHLPFLTDALLCEAIATRLEQELPAEVLLLPTQWLGASSHHLGMVGTLSAATETCLRMVYEPLRCLLGRGFRRVFVLNGHGGNTPIFHLALRQLALEFPQTVLGGASYWEPAREEIAALLEGDLKEVGHACEFETSLMLHLYPNLVRAGEALDDAILPTSEHLRGVFRPLDMKAQTRHGGHGRASLASAEEGGVLMEALVPNLVKAIHALRIS
jgi:creatinine amidohydrolase